MSIGDFGTRIYATKFKTKIGIIWYVKMIFFCSYLDWRCYIPPLKGLTISLDKYKTSLKI